MKNTFLKARDKGNIFGSMLISAAIFLGTAGIPDFYLILFFFV